MKTVTFMDLMCVQITTMEVKDVVVRPRNKAYAEFFYPNGNLVEEIFTEFTRKYLMYFGENGKGLYQFRFEYKDLIPGGIYNIEKRGKNLVMKFRKVGNGYERTINSEK